MGNYKFTMNKVLKTKGSPNKWASRDNRSELVSFIFLVGGSILQFQVVTVFCSWYKDTYNNCYITLCQAINIYGMLVCTFNKFSRLILVTDHLLQSFLYFSHSLTCFKQLTTSISKPLHFFTKWHAHSTAFLIILWHNINVTWLTSTVIHIKL